MEKLEGGKSCALCPPGRSLVLQQKETRNSNNITPMSKVKKKNEVGSKKFPCVNKGKGALYNPFAKELTRVYRRSPSVKKYD